MIKKFFQKLLNKSGKNYAIDEAIPDSLYLSFLFCRFVMMSRGLLFVHKKVFLGKNCVIKNKNIPFIIGLRTI